MYLYGASGHAKVIIEILRSRNIETIALFDDNPEIRQLAGIPVLGPYNERSENRPLIISIGNNKIRSKIASALKADFGTAIASTAVVSPTAVVNEGTVIMQGAVVQADAQIGKHCIINTSASVDHDCVLEDFVHISPHASLCGNVFVGMGTHVGAGATIIPNLRIGKWCTIAAGAVVVRDIPDHSKVMGVPGKIV